MKRSILLLFAALLMASATQAQVGFGTLTPDASSQVHIESTDRGLLIPRMTSFERTAIATPAAGLLVYDTDQEKFYYYNATDAVWYTLNPWDYRQDQNPGVLASTSDVRLDVIDGKPVVIGNPATNQTDLDLNGNLDVALDANTAGNQTIGGTLSVSGTTTFNSGIALNGDLNVAPPNTLNGYGTVPVGGIIMWSGTVASIPANWQLCNGTNGTPDLQGRFVVGYNPADAATPTIATNKEINFGAIGNTGGESVHILTELEMPTHTHNGQTAPDGTHTHDINPMSPEEIDANGGGGNDGYTEWATGPTVTTDPAGNHFHNFLTNPTGGGESHENRPPYYVLAFIMRMQ